MLPLLAVVLAAGRWADAGEGTNWSLCRLSGGVDVEVDVAGFAAGLAVAGGVL
jgi:hypothetical protein